MPIHDHRNTKPRNTKIKKKEKENIGAENKKSKVTTLSEIHDMVPADSSIIDHNIYTKSKIKK